MEVSHVVRDQGLAILVNRVSRVWPMVGVKGLIQTFERGK